MEAQQLTVTAVSVRASVLDRFTQVLMGSSLTARGLRCLGMLKLGRTCPSSGRGAVSLLPEIFIPTNEERVFFLASGMVFFVCVGQGQMSIRLHLAAEGKIRRVSLA
eukprot:COSAG02_NODE_4620_length_5156_cov_2.045284_2_plen_107_part_00